MPDFKSLFATPKKAALTASCVLVMLITLGIVVELAAGAFTQGPPDGGGPQDSPAAQGDPQEESPEPSRPGGLFLSKTVDEAREIALADAGLTASGAVFTGETLWEDNGLWVYKFNFQGGSTTYEYEINANTGAVYSKVIKAYAASGQTPGPAPEGTPRPASSQAPEGTPQPTSSQAPDTQPPTGAFPADTHHPGGHDDGHGQYTGDISGGIGLEQAKAAALADAGLSAGSVTFTKAELDWEDGVQVYELEFFTASHEYEYEIDASTGAVYSRSVEAFQTFPDGQGVPAQSTPGMETGSAYIGVSQAKSIALDHAGFTASQVMITKAAMDRDDGRMVYEIEFRQGQVEYEYKIDARSGAILEHEIDRD